MATSHQIIPSPSQFTKLNQVFHTKLIPGREGSHVFYDYFVYLHGIFQNSSCLRNLRNLLKQHNLSYLLQIYELTLCYIAKPSPIFFFFSLTCPRQSRLGNRAQKNHGVFLMISSICYVPFTAVHQKLTFSSLTRMKILHFILSFSLGLAK